MSGHNGAVMSQHADVLTATPLPARLSTAPLFRPSHTFGVLCVSQHQNVGQREPVQPLRRLGGQRSATGRPQPGGRSSRGWSEFGRGRTQNVRITRNLDITDRTATANGRICDKTGKARSRRGGGGPGTDDFPIHRSALKENIGSRSTDVGVLDGTAKYWTATIDELIGVRRFVETALLLNRVWLDACRS